jgi:hypothetical protein
VAGKTTAIVHRKAEKHIASVTEYISLQDFLRIKGHIPRSTAGEIFPQQPGCGRSVPIDVEFHRLASVPAKVVKKGIGIATGAGRIPVVLPLLLGFHQLSKPASKLSMEVTVQSYDRS